MREIIFDTETTGLSPAGGDRLVEIGCIEMFNRCRDRPPVPRLFQSRARDAERGRGGPRAVDDLPVGQALVRRTAEELLEFLGDAPLVAHNAGFDFGFLNHELDRCGRPAVCMSRMVDTLALARSRHPGAKHSLDALCSRFGVDRSQRVKHGALLDAQLLAQVYVELTGGRQIGLGLVAETAAARPSSRSAPASPREPSVRRARMPLRSRNWSGTAALSPS